MFQHDVGSKPVCDEAKIVKHAPSAGKKKDADDETGDAVKSFCFYIARLALRWIGLLLIVLQIESVYYCGDRKHYAEDQGPLKAQSRGLLGLWTWCL
jgi:hypothetical protein